jgi:ubiquitin-like protein ATG12
MSHTPKDQGPSSPLPSSPSPSPTTASPLPLADNEVAGSGAASPNLPLTMSASVVLADLPRDATAALEAAGSFKTDKIVVRFKPVGSAPSLAQDVCKISATRRFEEVVRYLRKKLRCKETDSVFLYVNSAFAPSLDEVVGNLHQCFKNSHGQLVVAYSLTPAFG